jgi:hypothetical protein
MVLRLTRELGVNLAGVEVILSMREKMEKLQEELEQSMERMQRSLAELDPARGDDEEPARRGRLEDYQIKQCREVIAGGCDEVDKFTVKSQEAATAAQDEASRHGSSRWTWSTCSWR